MSIQGTSRIVGKEDACKWLERQKWYSCEQMTIVNQIDNQPAILRPLKLVDYKRYVLSEKWDGSPLFRKEDGTLVQIFKHTFPKDQSGGITEFISIHPFGQKLNHYFMKSSCNCVNECKIDAAVSSVFGNIKHYAAIAFGLPMSVDAKHGLPPQGVVAKMNVKAFLLDRGAVPPNGLTYTLLTPLTYEECAKIKGWDGLPVFKNPRGNFVRPSITVNKETGEPTTASVSEGDEDDEEEFGIGVAPYMPGKSALTIETEDGDGPTLDVVPLFNQPLANDKFASSLRRALSKLSAGDQKED